MSTIRKACTPDDAAAIAAANGRPSHALSIANDALATTVAMAFETEGRKLDLATVTKGAQTLIDSPNKARGLKTLFA